MLKSCKYCSRIHDSKIICNNKQKAINDGQKKYKTNNLDIYRFRNSKAWQSKREEIKQRDNYLCQICIRKLYSTVNQYTYDGISVHHAESLETNWDERLDDNNLITTCDMHHEMMESGEIPLYEVKRIISEQEGKCAK